METVFCECPFCNICFKNQNFKICNNHQFPVHYLINKYQIPLDTCLISFQDFDDDVCVDLISVSKKVIKIGNRYSMHFDFYHNDYDNLIQTVVDFVYITEMM
jgi:hypothetical protein